MAFRVLPLLCPLCEQSAPAGDVCDVCQALLQASRQQPVQARCYRCDIGVPLTDERAKNVELSQALQCERCLLEAPAFDRVISAFDFAAPGDLLIHRIKAEKRLTLIPALARLLAQTYRQRCPDPPAPVVLVPVPAQAQSIRVRGFNPAAELAKALAQDLACDIQPHWLIRRHSQRPRQAALGRVQRLLAASQAYEVRQCPPDTHIVVVDDVMTTGSTLHYISRLFRRAGAASVTGLVLARTPHVEQPQ